MLEVKSIVVTAPENSRLHALKFAAARLDVASEFGADGLRRRLAGASYSPALHIVDLAAADADTVDRLQTYDAPASIFILADDDVLRERISLAPSVLAYFPVGVVGATIEETAHDVLLPLARLGDFTDRDSARLNTLGREVERVARALAELAGEVTTAAVAASVSAPSVRALLRRRRDRDRHFPAALFSDPAWDMLLDLTAARLERRVVSVSSLCIAAAVPTTTALRWIRNLCDIGLFERNTDPDDLRRGLISLSDDAHARMLAYLTSIGGAAIAS